MGQALYRKYRSKSLSEIIGQEHITDTLGEALKSGRLSHAYLFTGPRGVGKTSIARILAHEINGIPYTDDSAHMDIIEIDAASNRRIDEIRELRDKVYVAPTSAKYKVYIIDEVHMLTREAFNALLKTLEEPPAHVVFILATTDAHKLPDTIVSRTQRYSFRPVDKDKVIAHLKAIAEKENIAVSDDALGLLAEHGEGSFRDSISLLDQASSRGTKITIADIQRLLGIPPTEAITTLVTAVNDHYSSRDIATQLSALEDQGFQAPAIAKQIAQLVRADLISAQPSLQQMTSLALLEQLIEVPVAHDPERFLEITLLKLSSASLPAAPINLAPTRTTAEKTSTLSATSNLPASPKPTPDAPKIKSPASSTEVSQQTADKKTLKPVKAAEPAGSQPIDDLLWPKILDALKSKYNTLYGVVRMAHPTFTDSHTLQLAFAFAFHQKRVSDAKNRQIIADTIEQLSGQKLQIVCVLDKELASQPQSTSAPASKSSPSSDTPAALTAINSIFGGGEVVDS